MSRLRLVWWQIGHIHVQTLENMRLAPCLGLETRDAPVFNPVPKTGQGVLAGKHC